MKSSIPQSPMYFVCVLKSGGTGSAWNTDGKVFYDEKYVKVLAAALKDAGCSQYPLVCLTDIPEAVAPYAYPVRLQHDWPGWWSKCEIFRHGLLPSPFIYLDLDVMILGPVGEYVSLAIGAGDVFALLDSPRDSRRKNWFSSSQMIVPPTCGNEVYWELIRCGPSKSFFRQKREGRGPGQKGDQGWMRRFLRPQFLQDFLPDGYLVWKNTYLKLGENALKDCAIFNWTGAPRLSERKHPFYRTYWSTYIDV